MGGDMSRIVQGVYVGSYGNAANEEYLERHEVTHVLAVHNLSEEAHKKHKKARVHKRINISDINSENISRYFSECNDFIHDARLSNGNCLIHCQVGISRSVSITCAYLMSVTTLSFSETLRGIQGARIHASPNIGFRDQLVEFERSWLIQERERLKSKYGKSPFMDQDMIDLKRNIETQPINNEPIKVSSMLEKAKDVIQASREPGL